MIEKNSDLDLKKFLGEKGKVKCIELSPSGKFCYLGTTTVDNFKPKSPSVIVLDLVQNKIIGNIIHLRPK